MGRKITLAAFVFSIALTSTANAIETFSYSPNHSLAGSEPFADRVGPRRAGCEQTGFTRRSLSASVNFSGSFLLPDEIAAVYAAVPPQERFNAIFTFLERASLDPQHYGLSNTPTQQEIRIMIWEDLARALMQLQPGWRCARFIGTEVNTGVVGYIAPDFDNAVLFFPDGTVTQVAGFSRNWLTMLDENDADFPYSVDPISWPSPLPPGTTARRTIFPP